MATLKDLQELLDKMAKKTPELVIKIIKVEGLNFIKKNFNDEGFNTGSSVSKWAKRKTLNKNGRSITRYRTNRVGKAGSPNKYGRSLTNRALLTGIKTGADKLRNSFRASSAMNKSVSFKTYKKYAKTHNEGLGNMPKRRFIGKSRYLHKKIYIKLKKEFDKRLK